MGSFYSPLPRWSSHRAVALVFVGLLACNSGRGAPPQPAQSTRSDIRLAEEAEGRREHHQARALYRQAIAQAPNAHSHAYATREMASTLLFWGEYQGAARLLEQSLRSDDSQVQVWHDLGVLRVRLNDALGAEKALRQAISLAPREPRSRIALAALLVRGKQYVAAQAQYRTLLELPIPPKLEVAVRTALKLLKQEIALAKKPLAQQSCLSGERLPQATAHRECPPPLSRL